MSVSVSLSLSVSVSVSLSVPVSVSVLCLCLSLSLCLCLLLCLHLCLCLYLGFNPYLVFRFFPWQVGRFVGPQVCVYVCVCMCVVVTVVHRGGGAKISSKNTSEKHSKNSSPRGPNWSQKVTNIASKSHKKRIRKARRKYLKKVSKR